MGGDERPNCSEMDPIRTNIGHIDIARRDGSGYGTPRPLLPRNPHFPKSGNSINSGSHASTSVEDASEGPRLLFVFLLNPEVSDSPQAGRAPGWQHAGVVRQVRRAQAAARHVRHAPVPRAEATLVPAHAQLLERSVSEARPYHEVMRSAGRKHRRRPRTPW